MKQFRVVKRICKFLAVVLLLLVLIGGGRLAWRYQQVDPAQRMAAPLAAEAVMLEESRELTVMTLNLAGMPLFSADRYERYRALGAVITIHDPDIVVLQEAGDAQERARLIEELEYTGLQHHTYFESSVYGSGLLVLSAYPIAETAFHRFTANTPWYALWSPGWWQGRGVGLARLALAPDQYLDCYVFKLDDRADALRAQQWEETLAFIWQSREAAIPALLAGDWGLLGGEALQTTSSDTGLVLASLIEGNSGTTALHFLGDAEAAYTHELLESNRQEATFVKNQETLRLSSSEIYWSTLRIMPTP